MLYVGKNKNHISNSAINHTPRQHPFNFAASCINLLKGFTLRSINFSYLVLFVVTGNIKCSYTVFLTDELYIKF